MSTAGPLDGQIALVTGASRGLGFALARALGGAGAQVIATARTVGGLEELDDLVTAEGGAKPLLVPLDIAEGDALDQLGASLFERYGRIDILAHCAAHPTPLSPVAHGDQKDVDKAFAINTEATRRLIRSMDLLLRQSAAPQLLFTAHRKAGQKFWGPYAASKAAAESYVAAYLAETPKIRGHIVEPPPMPTALRGRTHPGEDQATLTPMREVAAGYVAALAGA